MKGPTVELSFKQKHLTFLTLDRAVGSCTSTVVM